MKSNVKQRFCSWRLSISNFYVLISGIFLLLAILQANSRHFEFVDWVEPIAWTSLVVVICFLTLFFKSTYFRTGLFFGTLLIMFALVVEPELTILLVAMLGLWVAIVESLIRQQFERNDPEWFQTNSPYQREIECSEQTYSIWSLWWLLAFHPGEFFKSWKTASNPLRGIQLCEPHYGLCFVLVVLSTVPYYIGLFFDSTLMGLTLQSSLLAGIFFLPVLLEITLVFPFEIQSDLVKIWQRCKANLTALAHAFIVGWGITIILFLLNLLTARTAYLLWMIILPVYAFVLLWIGIGQLVDVDGRLLRLLIMISWIGLLGAGLAGVLIVPLEGELWWGLLGLFIVAIPPALYFYSRRPSSELRSEWLKKLREYREEGGGARGNNKTVEQRKRIINPLFSFFEGLAVVLGVAIIILVTWVAGWRLALPEIELIPYDLTTSGEFETYERLLTQYDDWFDTMPANIQGSDYRAIGKDTYVQTLKEILGEKDQIQIPYQQRSVTQLFEDFEKIADLLNPVQLIDYSDSPVEEWNPSDVEFALQTAQIKIQSQGDALLWWGGLMQYNQWFKILRKKLAGEEPPKKNLQPYRERLRGHYRDSLKKQNLLAFEQRSILQQSGKLLEAARVSSTDGFLDFSYLGLPVTNMSWEILSFYDWLHQNQSQPFYKIKDTGLYCRYSRERESYYVYDSLLRRPTRPAGDLFPFIEKPALYIKLPDKIMTRLGCIITVLEEESSDPVTYINLLTGEPLDGNCITDSKLWNLEEEKE